MSDTATLDKIEKNGIPVEANAPEEPLTKADSESASLEDSMSAVRRLLFGQQMSEVQRQFDRLNKELQTETKRQRDSLARLQEDLSNMLQNQADVLQKTIAKEIRAVRADLTTLRDDLGSQESRITKEVASINDRLAAQEKRQTDALTLLSNQFSSSLHERAEALDHRLSAVETRLEQDKVSRADLSSALGHVASLFAHSIPPDEA